ncbi:MAG TPA: M20 family metallopeptidase [Gemmatimonadaceae bacterium]|nr:M20 family metallopeptidase [Gemmatimonadaceae bacterium]
MTTPPRPGRPTADPSGIPAALAGQFSDDDVERLIALRRDLHAHPELSWKEHRTADALTAELQRLKPAALDRVAGTGLVARIAGRDRAAPVVAVRGDIDALPIQEATGLPFTSRHDGVMHACGHDVHATWAVGAARLLAREPAAGDVLIVLQPAEELGEGATRVLESGALDNVRMIFGGHVDRRFEVGEVVAEEGALAASSDTFAMTITGRGAHGARPHEADDPIVGAAALVGALQTIVARRLDPGVAGVITVGTISAGSAPNVIPDEARLGGTIRATTAATRERLHDELRRIAAGIASAHSLEIAVDITTGTPPIVNPAGPARIAADAARALLGADAVVPFGVTNMGGEDFAFYLERMPGCFLRIGARERGGPWYAAHSPRFVAAEESLFVGAAVLAACARAASASLA